MSPEVGTIAAVIGALGTIASVAKGFMGDKGGGGAPGSPVSIALPGLPKGPLPADLAAAGAMKPELLGAVATSPWKGGLSGANITGPLPGMKGLLASPIGSGGGAGTTPEDLSGLMGDTANVFKSLG